MLQFWRPRYQGAYQEDKDFRRVRFRQTGADIFEEEKERGPLPLSGGVRLLEKGSISQSKALLRLQAPKDASLLIYDFLLSSLDRAYIYILTIMGVGGRGMSQLIKETGGGGSRRNKTWREHF